MITYYVEENVSDFSSSYLINEREGVKEKPLLFDHNVRGLLRTLQECIARGGKQKFTSCKLHFWADGKFETTYGYEEVDWNSLIYLGSNFFPLDKDGGNIKK